MSFNTCLFAWKALLTPTIEKIIFLSSAIFFILLIYVSCHISLFFLHLSVIPRMCEELIHQQQNDTDTNTYPINGIGMTLSPHILKQETNQYSCLPHQLIGIVSRSPLAMPRQADHFIKKRDTVVPVPIPNKIPAIQLFIKLLEKRAITILLSLPPAPALPPNDRKHEKARNAKAAKTGQSLSGYKQKQFIVNMCHQYPKDNGHHHHIHPRPQSARQQKRSSENHEVLSGARKGTFTAGISTSANAPRAILV